MGLFDKKAPCAICGGKVKGLFPWKVEGQLICNDCHGVVHLPADLENNMTLEQFCAYRAFREENNKLKENFQTSATIDFGFLCTKFVFDLPQRLMCPDKNLAATVFKGSDIVSFTIREDAALLYEGSANGLTLYPSAVPDRAMAMGTQINHYLVMAQMRRDMQRMSENGAGRDQRAAAPAPTFDIPEPFQRFNLDIHFRHPYWGTLTASMDGPRFDNNYPDLNNYMNSYAEQTRTMDQLANLLMTIAFPNGPAAAPAAPAAPASPAQPDTVEELRRYKELLDQGILTEEEFTAKKRQLLGL